MRGFPARGRLSRRGLLAGGTAAALGAVAARSAGPAAASTDTHADLREQAAPAPGGPAVEPFHGVHQAGVATAPQTYGTFVAFDLKPKTDRAALVRLMKLLTDDARRLTQGRPALADTEAELALLPARLTVTIGFGPGLFRAAGAEKLAPEPLPSFSVDRLERRWSDGDLLVQVCADDRITLFHAVRMIIKDTRAFASVRWTQQGFRQAPHVQPPGVTQRNLMGQLDGTVNPTPGTPDFDRAVWVGDAGPQWLRGGTMCVIRRIRMDMEKWDEVDPVGREFTIGRRLADGAPLTGTKETDEPDFDKLGPNGLLVISEYAHIRRARQADPALRMLRRPYNYDEGVSEDGTPDAGLLFVSFQADVARQFVPVQQRLAEADLLNAWITPVGSALFAIPPGTGPDGYIGETLLG